MFIYATFTPPPTQLYTNLIVTNIKYSVSPILNMYTK